MNTQSGRMPDPWDVSCEFMRQVCWGFLVTFSPQPVRVAKHVVKTDALQIQIVVIKNGEARELPGTFKLGALEERIAEAISAN